MKKLVQKLMENPIWVIIGMVVLLMGSYTFRDREVRGYFVEWKSGFYYVTADVKGGMNFVSYVSMSGDDAISAMDRLNGVLMKENGKPFKPVVYR